MTTQELQATPRRARFNPLALPIAVKIGIALVVTLAITGLITNGVIRQVVSDAQTTVSRDELQTHSRTQALRLIDAMGQETVSLTRLGTVPVIQQGLTDVLAHDEALGANASADHFVHLFQDAQLTQELESFLRTSDEFDAVALLDVNGHLLTIEPIPSQLEVAVTPNWDWFDSALAGGAGKVYIFGPADDQLTHLTGVHITVPVYDASDPGRLLGVIYAVWNLSNVGDVTAPFDVRETQVIEPDGTILMGTGAMEHTVIPADLLDSFHNQPKGSFPYTDTTGKGWLYGYNTFNNIDINAPTITSLRWIVSTRMPLSSLAASAAPLANRLRLAVGLSALAVTLITAMLIVLTLRPLGRLTDAAARIQAGALDTSIPQFPADEVGKLAGVLDSVVSQLLHRLRQLSSAVQVSRATILTLDIDQLLHDVAETLVEQFGYPGVRIYLTDTGGRQARLQAAAGIEAADMLRVEHRLPVDEHNVIGRAILMREPQFGGTLEPVAFAGTRVRPPEVALSLDAGGRTLGALHIIGRPHTVFQQEDINILTLITDQLSAAIENVRLFEQSAANLTEIEALNRRLTHQAWEDHLKEGTLRHTRDPERHWPETTGILREQTEIRAETYVDADGRAVLAAPLVLRGEAIGTLAVTRPPGERWSHDEVTLLESVASRLAMIAESIRLVEESSLRAEREQRVNEVSASLLQRAASVDSVLQTALNQLGGALGSEHVSLRIGRPPGDGGPARSVHDDGTGNGSGDDEHPE